MNITDFYPDYKEVGYTKKTFGVSGKLRIHIHDSFLPSILKADHCFLLIQGCMVPYFIINKEEEKREGVLEFDWINTPEEAKEIVAKTIFLHTDQIKEGAREINTLTFGFLEGFSLFDDETEEEVGYIQSIDTYPEQEIATVVKEDGGDFMIPLNAESITGIDEEGKNLWMIIPDGIIDL